MHDFAALAHEAKRGAIGAVIDGRTTRHEGYAKSQHARSRDERPFGWMKTIGWTGSKVAEVGERQLILIVSAAFNLLGSPRRLRQGTRGRRLRATFGDQRRPRAPPAYGDATLLMDGPVHFSRFSTWPS
jgi:hypothetical protein